ncbi:uncharacterized protein VTP21DRAFT_1304 [Calcarisporiella thermophila]|uniref:uncharacterized protein n=1 Tax=Calcarisporiella thermophila TaxID=911321 RepID=UPI0037430CB7
MQRATLVRRYLPRFILQIHPDFFHGTPDIKQLNAQSLQTLQSRLQPHLASSQSSMTPSKNDDVVLEFHLKTKKRIEHKLEGGEGLVQSFLALCQKAGLDVQPADLAASAPSSPPPPSTSTVKHHDTLVQQFAEQLRHSAPPTARPPSSIHSQPNRLLFFRADVSGDKRQIVSRLKRSFREGGHGRWWGRVPVLVVGSALDQLPGPGFLVIRENMSNEELSTYLYTRIPLALKELEAKRAAVL